MRASKLVSAAVFMVAVFSLSFGNAFAGGPGGGIESVEASSHKIVTKHDHTGDFQGNYGSYNWAGFSTPDTMWTFKVHAKEAADRSYSRGTVHFYGENPDGSYVDVVGQVEYAHVAYPYWLSSRGDVLLLAGRAQYNGMSYDFMYLESEMTVWIALSDSQTWEDRVALNGVFTERDYQVHSNLVADQFDLSEKPIR